MGGGIPFVTCSAPSQPPPRRLDGSMTSASERAKAATPRSLSGLLPFLRPYRGRIVAAIVFLMAASITTLAFPVALRKLIDGGLALPSSAVLAAGAANGARVMALRDHFLELFG